MNFLSHFYFERYAAVSERVLGSLLPDLLRNVDRDYTFHPQRYEEQLFSHPIMIETSKGWYGHIEVDKIFHNCEFFFEHNHELRKKLDPVLEDLPVRASFMGHVSLELILDHLLIRDQVVSVTRLYEHLMNVNQQVLEKYLKIIGLEDTKPFLDFYNKFIEWKYIYDYADLSNISRPLFNIAKRLWDFDASERHHVALSEVLIEYADKSLSDYKSVYKHIQDKMTIYS